MVFAVTIGMTTTRYAYAALRRSKSDGEEWVDIQNCCAGDYGSAQSKADRIDKELPGYALMHPVQSIVKVRIEVVWE